MLLAQRANQRGRATHWRRFIFWIFRHASVTIFVLQLAMRERGPFGWRVAVASQNISRSINSYETTVLLPPASRVLPQQFAACRRGRGVQRDHVSSRDERNDDGMGGTSQLPRGGRRYLRLGSERGNQLHLPIQHHHPRTRIPRAGALAVHNFGDH